MILTIQGELTDLNSYIKAINGHYLAGNNVKQTQTLRVYWEARKQKIQTLDSYPIKIIYTWYCKNERKDIDNVAFAKKFINDGLVMAKVLKDDSRKYVNAFEDRFFIDKTNPRVEVAFIPTK